MESLPIIIGHKMRDSEWRRLGATLDYRDYWAAALAP